MTAKFQVLTLKCPNCSASLEISQDMDSFACGYCGSQQTVQRRGGTVSLKLVTDAISKVQAGTDRTASELAIQRITKELAALTYQRQALIRTYNAKRQGIQLKYVGGFFALGFLALLILINIRIDYDYPFKSPWGFLIAGSIFAVGFILSNRREQALEAGHDRTLHQIRDTEQSLTADLSHHRDIVRPT